MAHREPPLVRAISRTVPCSEWIAAFQAQVRTSERISPRASALHIFLEDDLLIAG